MLKLFTVYDSKSETYIAPFAQQGTGEAVRGFIQVLNQQDTDYYKYPADKTLFEVGSFDFRTGQILPLPALINLGNGAHMKPKGVTNEI